MNIKANMISHETNLSVLNKAYEAPLSKHVYSRQLKYMGHVNNINDLYKKVHVAVLPSYREGLPKGLLEAAAYGKPIITTNVTGCRDVVIDGKNGILVNPKNSDELFLAMKKMLQNKKIRLAMGKEGRIFVKENFLIENTVKKLIHLYKYC